MRVLLVYPSIDCPIGVNHGLTMISGVLREAGHDTRLIHVNEKLFDVPDAGSLLAQVREYEPGVIGFSLMTQQYEWSVQMAKALRAAFPGLPLVAGGVHCTMVPEQVVSDGHFDVVALGEAELSFRELVDCIERGEDPTGVANMRFPMRSLFNRRLTPIVNPVGNFPQLDRIAPNHYELFDMDRIVRSKNGWFGVLTSRGCPYRCTYCFNREIVDRYVEDGAVRSAKEYLRHYPVERMIDELLELKRRYPIKTFLLDDDLFTLDREYVRDFCAAYKASGLRLPYVLNAHVQVFDDEMAFLLHDSGCRIVKFGLESGSPRIRKQVLVRTMSNATIERAFRAAQRYGLHSSAFVMYGLPTETRADLIETLKLCAKIELGRFRWAIFFPFPGTGGYRIAEELDLIDHHKMKGLGNYFDGSCLRLGEELDLFVEKLGRVSHWWVNTFAEGWGCAPYYEPLVAEVESWTRAEWNANKGSLHARDRALSEQLLSQGIRHYSLRYTHVMAVDSDFVLQERSRLQNEPEYVPAGYTLDD